MVNLASFPLGELRSGKLGDRVGLAIERALAYAGGTDATSIQEQNMMENKSPQTGPTLQ